MQIALVPHVADKCPCLLQWFSTNDSMLVWNSQIFPPFFLPLTVHCLLTVNRSNNYICINPYLAASSIYAQVAAAKCDKPETGTHSSVLLACIC